MITPFECINSVKKYDVVFHIRRGDRAIIDLSKHKDFEDINDIVYLADGRLKTTEMSEFVKAYEDNIKDEKVVVISNGACFMDHQISDIYKRFLNKKPTNEDIKNFKEEYIKYEFSYFNSNENVDVELVNGKSTSEQFFRTLHYAIYCKKIFTAHNGSMLSPIINTYDKEVIKL